MTFFNGCTHELLKQLPIIAERWRMGKLNSAVFAAQYFLIWQVTTHGKVFASRQYKNVPRPYATEWLEKIEMEGGEQIRATLIDWFVNYQFRGVIANVPATLVQWLRGAWPLVLREDIPSPLEVLRMQARGIRAVTAITSWPRMCEPVLKQSDAFSFFQHDLGHAYKFYHSPVLYAGQIAFFTALEAAIDNGIFGEYLDDAEFVAKFHYLISDMNTHPVHSMHYLRAIMIDYHLRHEQKKSTESLSLSSEREIKQIMRTFKDTTPLTAYT